VRIETEKVLRSSPTNWTQAPSRWEIELFFRKGEKPPAAVYPAVRQDPDR
jgi:hypothetical protein